ncbi:hypothetical protein BDQ17DRAFT_1328645 [Cyathus striatus]|nr:hypothetical protein BDQ17DRAFT_1328645 [Cyathus striatus]
MASSSSSSTNDAGAIKRNNNPNGKNQYQGRPGRDDPHVEELLKKYHRDGITDRRELSKRFLNDHGIMMSERTVARRKGQLGLHSSRLTTLKLSEDEKRQLILDQMSKDPKGKMGPRTVKKGIFEDTGISLTRDYIIEAMRTLAPEAYDARSPAHAKEKRKNRLLKQASQSTSRDESSITTTTTTANSSLHLPQDTSTSRNSSGSGHHSETPSLELESALLPTGTSTPEPGTISRSVHFDTGMQVDSEASSTVQLQPLAQSAPPMPISLPPIFLNPPTTAPTSTNLPISTTAPSSTNPHTTTPNSNTNTFPHLPSTTSTTLSLALQGATPRISDLTRFLRGVDMSLLSPEEARGVFGDALKCMEAAALLERQLARVAGTLQGRSG